MTGEAQPVRVAFVGHATVLVDMDGVRMLTDPLLRGRVAHLRRYVAPASVGALRGVDTVLVSHAHADHLDLPSLQRLGVDVAVVVPRGLAGLLRRKRFRHVVEIDVGDRIRVGGVEVEAVFADHPGERFPFGARADPIGFLLRGSRTVYFAGDTDLFPGMAQLGPVDVALVPIWGWGPTLGPGHLDPSRAAEAVALVRPRSAIPIHWGTYAPIHAGVGGRPAWLDTPPRAFADAVARRAPTVDVIVLRPGEETVLSSPSASRS